MTLDPERKHWEEQTLGPTLKRFPERKTEFTTLSGIPLPRVSTPADPDPDYMEKLGFPGEYPFTRGVQPTLYRGRLWTMRQYAGYATAEDSNRRYRYLLDQGQTGLSVAFDLPTQIGYDADDPIARGEVGKVGVSISSLEDMETLFRGIPLDKVSTSMTINAPASILLALYIAVAKRQGVEPRQLRGTIQNDILKEYIARGTYIFPPGPSMRLITDVFRFCQAEVPHWNTISISGYHIREAGSTAVQEVAFTLANAIAYVQAAVDAGLDVDSFAGQLSFFFNAHNNFLEEVAKFRAARRMWARLMKERFEAKKPASWMLRFHTQTGGSTLTAQQPINNVVRVSLQALAAVLGGTQSLHTNSWDEALALPTEASARLALRTQQIIACETGVADTIDPLGGSFHVERLTDELEARAEAYLKKIDELGGMVRAIEQGYPQKEIQDAAFAAQRAQESKDALIVGVNAHTQAEAPVEGLLRVDESVEAEQVQRLKELRQSRSGDAVRRSLDALRQAAARPKENVVPFVFDAVKAEATLGEVSDALRDVFGQHREQVVL